MTQKEKELLLQDLCARLPYGVRYKGDGGWGINPYQHTTSLCTILASEEPLIYLRPLSSMTEKERLELSRLTDDKFKFYLYTAKPEIVCYEKYNYLEGLKVLDWLNAHHFDYRGLIPMGLALPAPEDMYK